MKFFKNIILVFFFSILISNSGSIVGTVIDSDTHQPIIGANIIVLPLEIGANTDENGEFFIQKIPVGSYSVLASTPSLGIYIFDEYQNIHNLLKEKEKEDPKASPSGVLCVVMIIFFFSDKKF